QRHPEYQWRDKHTEFISMDCNNDGILSIGEFTDANRYRIKDPIQELVSAKIDEFLSILTTMDRNGDGKISLVEWEPQLVGKIDVHAMQVRPEEWDLNHDSEISIDEVRGIFG